MKKIRLLVTSLFVVIALTSCSVVSTGSDSEKLVLTLGHSYGTDSLPNRAAELYSKKVKESTEGKVEIRVFPSSQLGSWEEMQEGLELETMDALIESVGTLERYTPLASIEGVPFLYSDTDHLFRVWDSDLGQDILDRLEKETGFKLLGRMYFGQRILNTSRPIKNLEDLKGLKLRVPPQKTYIDTWKALGASPTPMSLDETFSAIEQGVVEGQENPVDVARFDSFYEVAPNITRTNHLMGNMHFQFWSHKFNSYPPDVQKVLKEKADEVSVWYRETALKEEQENEEFLRKHGTKFYDVDRDQWKKRVSTIYQHLDPQVAAWVKQIQRMDKRNG